MHAMWAYRGRGGTDTLLTSALECLEWSPSHIGCFTPTGKGSPHNYWIGNWVSPSLSLNCPAFNLVIIPSTLMQVVRKMTRNFSHSSLCCSWYLKWAPFKYMSDAWLHEPTCPTKTLYLARQDDSYDWWLHMFIQHSATGLLAIFQAGSSLEENWLMYGIWYR